MKKLTYLLTALYFAVLLGGCGSDNSAKDAGAPQVLNLYGWADYFDPDVISDFEKQNNCKITYDVFSNNEELLAKMKLLEKQDPAYIEELARTQYNMVKPGEIEFRFHVK